MNSDGKKARSFSVGKKIYLFVGLTVFTAALFVAIISHFINANRIDDYFKRLARDTARNFASGVDADYMARLREVIESQEYQTLRDQAEEAEDEAVIEAYLRDKGLWEDYKKIRDEIMVNLNNMEGVKYLYLVAWGGKEDLYDMYLITDEGDPLYTTGYYEEREQELLGIDASMEVEPTISHGDWGWLCSAFVPVYSADGTLVCQVGCDVAMDDIIMERRINFMYIILAALLFTAAILAGVMWLIRRTVIRPLDMITAEMKRFSPSDSHDYEESGVMNLEISSNDEIEDIYNGIRSMQIRILDYLDDITAIQKEKEKAEVDIRQKEKEIGEISKDAYRDPLTHVGSKIAYNKKLAEMNETIHRPGTEFAIVMVDVNFLKLINDRHGHAAGDSYLAGCCDVICRIYKHSPVFRIGGDEFTVILTGEDYRNREERLEEVRTAFTEAYHRTDGDPWLRFSAASGMAVYSAADDSVEAVFGRADKLMYAEKAKFKQSLGMDPKER